MEIIWLAHSCFRLRSNGVTVLTDPFPSSIGGRLVAVNPTIVTISNQHPNHSHMEGVPGEFHLIDGPGEYAISGIYIKGVMTPMQPGQPYEECNTAYLLEAEGLSLCHLGDLNTVLSDQLVDELTPVDVLLVPAGGACTLSVKQSGEIIQALSPRIVVPMHYKAPGINVELEELDAFLRETGTRVQEPEPRLNVTSTSLPAETKVVVLKPTGITPGAG